MSRTAQNGQHSTEQESPVSKKELSQVLRTANKENRLDSWKEIATYLDREVRTVQRWEKAEGLPVRRHRHQKIGTIFAFKREIDAWREGRVSRPSKSEVSLVPKFLPSSPGGAVLRKIAKMEALTHSRKKVSWGWAHTQAGPAIVCFNLVAPVHKANSPHRSGKRQVNARVPLRKGGAVYLLTDSIGCAEF
ncbi:MAG TPA: hypothetical protein VNX66_02775 [Candidatus Sulfotelmatobacter sp.]|nr:hypothetical protein [Candidatus Sulfotelmatobacter sp.]